MKAKIFILLFIVLLTGCDVSGKGVNDRAIVERIGIDYEDGVYVISLKILPYEDGGTEEENDNAHGSREITELIVRGSTVNEAIVNSITYLKKSPYFAHLDNIIISKEVASTGIGSLIDYFNRNVEFRKSTVVYLSKEKASDIIFKSTNQLNSSDLMEKIEGEGVNSETVFYAMLLDISKIFADNMSDLVLPVLDLQDVKDKALQVSVIKEAAVFKDDTLSYTIPSSMIRSILLLNNALKHDNYTLNTEKHGKISIYLENCDINTKVKTIDNQPVFDIKIESVLLIKEIEKNYKETPSKDDLNEITEAYNKLIREEINKCIDECLHKNKSDIFGISEKLKMKSVKEYEKLKYNIYDSKINLELNTKL